MQRRLLLAASGAWVFVRSTDAAARRNPESPLRLGVDGSLVESGLARSLQRAFGSETGIAVKVVAGPASAILGAARDGEVDAALTNAPEPEADLERQGLVHDRRPIASGAFMLVGMPRLLGKPETLAAMSVEQALAALRDVAAAASASVVFLSSGDGSGLHLAEQRLWRNAGIAPVAPWYVSAYAGPSGRPSGAGGFVTEVRQRGAFALVERGAWLVAGGAPLAPIASAAAPIAEPVHVMRAFRASHPAGKLFVEWIAGPRGRAVVARQRGYRVPDRPGRA